MKEIQLYIPKASNGLKKYAATIAEDQLKKLAKYEAAIKAQKTNQSLTPFVPVSERSQALKPIEEPLAANKVELYDPDIFGLEVAARECRFEMIKIVREVRQILQHPCAPDTDMALQVDAVTKDPQVACDPDRTSQYLSPSIFRLLLPVSCLLSICGETGLTSSNLDAKQRSSAYPRRVENYESRPR